MLLCIFILLQSQRNKARHDDLMSYFCSLFAKLGNVMHKPCLAVKHNCLLSLINRFTEIEAIFNS